MTAYYAGRCPLCRRATLHLTPVGKARMEARGYCDMCKREDFIVPRYHLANIEQRLLQVASWDAEKPGPVPIMARAHQLAPDARGPLRRLYTKRTEQYNDYRALMVDAGVVREEVLA